MYITETYNIDDPVKPSYLARKEPRQKQVDLKMNSICTTINIYS